MTAQPRVVAIVPARNEEDSIADTISALRAQRHLPDEIIVVCNNCDSDDRTAEISRKLGVTVFNLQENKYRKAGALNYALSQTMPSLKDDDLILIQDADTMLNPDFTTNAISAMAPDIGGVCAQYDSPSPQNIIERLQSNEFARSRRRIIRKGGKTKILVGIASIFRTEVLRKVIDARVHGKLSGEPTNTVYNNNSLTEDYELSLALQLLGYRIFCPPGCRPKTHAMPTISKLWGQRVRWSRGGLDDLYHYGPSKVTRYYIFAQVNRMVTMMSPFLYGLYLLSLQLTYGHIAWDRPWLLINVLFILERVVTVREEGWRGMLTAALLVPELAYDWFMSAAYLAGLRKHLAESKHEWADT